MITKPVATVIYEGVLSVSARRSISTACHSGFPCVKK